MATSLLVPIKNQTIAYETIIASGGGLKTLFFPVDPKSRTSIQIGKNSEDVTTSVTTVTRKTTAVAATIGAGQEIADLELAQYNEVDTGTDDYIANDSPHLTCVKVVATPISANVIITIQQHSLKT